MNKSTPNMLYKRVYYYPLIQAFSPQEEAKMNMRLINEYDLDKMIEELRFHDTLSKIKKNKISKVKTENSIYRTNVNLMKTKVEEIEKKRIKNIQNELKKKNRIIEANKNQKSKEKEEERLKAMKGRIKLENKLKLVFNRIQL